MKTIIAGGGEVGQALEKVLAQYKPQVIDPARGLISTSVNCDILHICFPYSEEFIELVEEYKVQLTPKYIVIHSTVPLGTCEELDAIHSPTVGLHPFLETSMKTFTKFLGGEDASSVANYFRRAGLKVYLFDDSRTTELLKLLDTTFYALCIEYTKNIKRLTGEMGLPFEAWTLYNDDYNRGYRKLGFPEYIRPNLTPIMTRQGGHCTIPNCDLLGGEFAELVKKLNAKYGHISL